MRPLTACLLFLLAAGLASGAPPDVSGYPAEIKPAGQYATFVPTAPAASVSYVGLDGVDPVPSALLKDGRTFLLDTRGLKAGRYRFAAVAASKTGEQARADIVVVVGNAPPGPGPGPTPPPKPDPEPTPVTDFKVLLVFESGQTHTAAQTSVMYGKQVEEWLNANATTGKTGWGRVDKDFPPERMPVLLLTMWRATQPKVNPVVLPCWAVAVNGAVTFEPLGATPAEAIATLNAKREGK